jgi:AbrB family looped-hinge helix DNA binding protein
VIIRSTVTGKNQVTIPAAVARELKIEPGMQVEWELRREDCVLIMRPVESRAEKVKRLEGLLQSYLKPGDDPIADLIRERIRENEQSE